ncbi:MAG: ABC-type transport auxiliary lipoprotein family protein [Gammaproteobacteria bacterium]|nr:ABC-type transport auxiliary lipoprotein family protein [Gammaproteobacteria bacterium]
MLPERVPTDLYQLPPSSLRANSDGQTLNGLRIDTPTTSDALGGSRVLVMPGDNSFQAYPDARWSAPAALLWRDWILDAFWRDGRVSALSTSSDGLEASVELGGMLRGLHHERLGGRSQAVIRYDAQLVQTGSRRILASHRFEASEPVNGDTVGDFVAALGVAADRLATDLIEWTITSGQ